MTSEEFRNNPLFLRNGIKGKGIFDIPVIKKETINLKDIQLIGYDKISNADKTRIVHFFLDDYKFETIWNHPDERIDILSQFKAVLSPQFSLYSEMPMSLKIFNTFKNRWCGTYLQKRGVKVIPSLSWGEPDTFWFCFDGIEKGSVVAVSTVGLRKVKELFLLGYQEMLRKINPSAIICYGKPFDEMKGHIIAVDYNATNNRSKGFYVHKTYFSDVPLALGMGNAGAPKIPTVNISDLPANVQRAYYGYDSVGWKGNYPGQSKGTRAGGNYDNDPIVLPQSESDGKPISYQEYDVNDKVPGVDRGKERFVHSSDGNTYYSPDHYVSFLKVEV
ncbi:MAG: DUF4417 domain-containing protein [Ruminococcus sp.]|nr:DUF4417 domain-containing protein [Ruminococcus sp.]